MQNRASAVLDAYDQFENRIDVNLAVHLHALPVKQIETDMYGEYQDFKKRYGVKSSNKFYLALKKCIKEIKSGINIALASAANHVPYEVVFNLGQHSNIKQIADEFFHEMMSSKEPNMPQNRHIVRRILTSVCAQSLDLINYIKLFRRVDQMTNHLR